MVPSNEEIVVRQLFVPRHYSVDRKEIKPAAFEPPSFQNFINNRKRHQKKMVEISGMRGYLRYISKNRSHKIIDARLSPRPFKRLYNIQELSVYRQSLLDIEGVHALARNTSRGSSYEGAIELKVEDIKKVECPGLSEKLTVVATPLSHQAHADIRFPFDPENPGTARLAWQKALAKSFKNAQFHRAPTSTPKAEILDS